MNLLELFFEHALERNLRAGKSIKNFFFFSIFACIIEHLDTMQKISNKCRVLITILTIASWVVDGESDMKIFRIFKGMLFPYFSRRWVKEHEKLCWMWALCSRSFFILIMTLGLIHPLFLSLSLSFSPSLSLLLSLHIYLTIYLYI